MPFVRYEDHPQTIKLTFCWQVQWRLFLLSNWSISAQWSQGFLLGLATDPDWRCEVQCEHPNASIALIPLRRWRGRKRTESPQCSNNTHQGQWSPKSRSTPAAQAPNEGTLLAAPEIALLKYRRPSWGEGPSKIQKAGSLNICGIFISQNPIDKNITRQILIRS